MMMLIIGISGMKSGSTQEPVKILGHAPPTPHTGLDWPLCHCAMAQAPPFDEHRRPLAPSKFFDNNGNNSVDRQHYR